MLLLNLKQKSLLRNLINLESWSAIMNKKILVSLAAVVLLTGCQALNGDGTADSSGKNVVSTSTETTSSVEPEKKEPVLPNVSTADWNLLLVNSDNPMDSSREIPLTVLSNGLQIDQRMEPDYTAWMDAAKNAGLSMVLISAYRSIDLQKTVYDQSIQDYLNQGKDYETALKETNAYVAYPGASEHHSALAVDMVDSDWLATGKGLIPEYDQTASQKWLMQTMKDYGFILRFPKSKEASTKISYESWHFRYVGKENAAYIIENNLSLEEYIAKLKEAGK